jgi:hypothetical protein
MDDLEKAVKTDSVKELSSKFTLVRLEDSHIKLTTADKAKLPLIKIGEVIYLAKRKKEHNNE